MSLNQRWRAMRRAGLLLLPLPARKREANATARKAKGSKAATPAKAATARKAKGSKGARKAASKQRAA